MYNSRYWKQIEATFQKQRQKGFDTYGHGLEENTADIIARLNHLEEELIDGLMYIQWIKDLFGDEDGESI